MEKYILVFGGCGWDCTFKQREDKSYGNVPDAEMPGGKGANQAVAIARAGCNVKIITLVGDDEYGKKIVKNFQDNGVDTSLIKILNGIKSDSCCIYVSFEGNNDIIRTKEAIDKFTSDLIYENADLIKNAEYVVTQSKLPRQVYVDLINFCSQNGVKVVLTPCPSKDLKITNEENLELLRKVTFITANEEEAMEIAQEKSIMEAVEKLPNLLATAGDKGVYFWNEEGIKNMPALIPEKIVDTTGAGDTFCGNFVAKMVKGHNKEVSIKYGIKASTLKLEKLGAQPGMPYEYELEDERYAKS